MTGPLDFPPEGPERPGRSEPPNVEPTPRRGPAGADPRRPVPPPPARPPGASRYGWFVGVAAMLLLAVVLLNSLRTEGPGATGLQAGGRLPPFAAPLVLSDLDGDVNVAARAGSGEAGRVPACTVRGPDVVNSCELGRDRPLVVGFLFTRGADCAGAFDAMERVRRRIPEVAFAGIVVRGDREAARRLVRRHRWGFPVGFDRDGGLANRYGVAVCPELVLALPGGRVRETVIGDGVTGDLERRVRALVATARRSGWRAPA